MSNSNNNSKIAKNTAFLYFRMLLTMFVSLYTSRVVLQVLGVTDFGIYNVVGGVVIMLSFFNSSLATATQRYLNYEMGLGNESGLEKVFSMSFWGFCLIAVITLFLAETVGLWFIHHQLVIPIERFDAALIVFHFSVLTFTVDMLMIPYNSAIIAHERMSVYAYVSIGEVVLKLLLVFLLTVIDYDKLVVYGLLLFLVSIIVALTYWVYCVRSFKECRVRCIWDKQLLKGLFAFSGWMLFGTITNMLSTQGINILINIYFGPILNGARAVAMQVNGAVSSFSNNFMTAVRPQIVLSYAQGKFEHMNKLVFTSSKISFYLLFLLVLPIIFNADYILALWLKNVPDYAVLFTQLVLIDLLINSAYGPIAYVSQASGKIRDYQLVISISFLLIVMFSWLGFYWEYPVYVTFIITIIVDVLGLFMRLYVLYKTVHFPVINYCKKVIFPVCIVFLLSLIVAYIPAVYFKIEDLQSVALYVICILIVTIALIFFIGLNTDERELVSSGINKFYNKIKFNRL